MVWNKVAMLNRVSPDLTVYLIQSDGGSQTVSWVVVVEVWVVSLGDGVLVGSDEFCVWEGSWVDSELGAAASVNVAVSC